MEADHIQGTKTSPAPAVANELSENFSEKPKRGRPQSSHRRIITNPLMNGLSPEGCVRTKVDWYYSLPVLAAFEKLDEESQRVVFGGKSFREISKGEIR